LGLDLSQFTILPQIPQKMTFGLEVLKIVSKINHLALLI